jgi:hypothetical protein
MGCFAFLTHPSASVLLGSSNAEIEKNHDGSPPSSTLHNQFSIKTTDMQKNDSATNSMHSPEKRNTLFAAIYELCGAFLQLFAGIATDKPDAESFLSKLCNLFATDLTLPFDDPKVIDAVFQLRMYH